MTDPQLPAAPQDGEARMDALVNYLRTNGDAYTPDALAGAARAAGFTEAEIEAALAKAGRIAPTAGPEHRSRARWLVVGIYGLTFLVFAFFFLKPTEYNNYGAGGIATFILAVTMGLTLLLSFWSIRRSNPRATTANGLVAGLLIGPMILLIAVSGLCVATTAPAGLFR
jgi:hypothetical protein